MLPYVIVDMQRHSSDTVNPRGVFCFCIRLSAQCLADVCQFLLQDIFRSNSFYEGRKLSGRKPQSAVGIANVHVVVATHVCAVNAWMHFSGIASNAFNGQITLHSK